ncbi:response regulator [Cohnella soli]|uniref:Response regulator n=1 Tax=Cohnella soli TaxID=425005 RepID=A0ABW0HWC0_9BACL
MYEVLLVDDHTHLVDSMAIGLPWDELGISAVHKAYSGEEALELLGYHSIDIIVTDIQMNGMNGLELIAAVHERRNVKTVILTGYDEFQYAKEALQQRVSDYLLKPVPNEELKATIRRIVAEIEEEGKRLINQQKIGDLFRESLPKVRESLLLDLIAGKNVSFPALREKIRLYELPYDLAKPVTLLCLRIEEDYPDSDLLQESLMEYALFNITDEILSDSFHVWRCKDPYDYLIILVQPKDGEEGPRANVLAEELARHAQHQIKLYLKTKVSIVMSPPGLIHEQLSVMYQTLLSAYSDLIGYQTESFLSAVQDQRHAAIRPLSELRAAPTFLQLIDGGQWGAFEQKLSRAFHELERQENNANEYGFEIYAALLHAFTYYAHKKGKRFFEVFGRDVEMMLKAEASRSAEPLREWAFDSFNLLKAISDNRSDKLRSSLMDRVYRYVAERLNEATLQTVADHVHLHPVYVSNLFKQESGENFTAYVLRLRMEKAALLLRQTELKVNQVALEIGYQKPQYFIKLFKAHFGTTPQEFRGNG